MRNQKQTSTPLLVVNCNGSMVQKFLQTIYNTSEAYVRLKRVEIRS
jgi:hypothetical protein